MTFHNNLYSPKITLIKQSTTSGASRSKYFFKNLLPIQLKHKKLISFYKWKSGRSSQGHVVVWTRKKKSIKTASPSINHSFRSTYLNFIAGFLIKPYTNKLLSLVFTASGSVSYLPTTSLHSLFTVNKPLGTFFRTTSYLKQLRITHPQAAINSSLFLVKHLPKNQPVALLEILPNKGIQYARSTGTSATILKMDSRIRTSLIKLPSGVKKIFSTYSLGSVGTVALPDNKKWSNNSAGFYSKHGKKPKVRGVAMNPVDHPHGGRNKAIRYQRTPWGKTTKFK